MPCDGVENIITYLNGVLELWEIQRGGSLHCVESLNTPALEIKYKLFKTFPHLSVMLYGISKSMVVNGEMTEKNRRDLLKEKERLELFLSLDDVEINKHRHTIRTFLVFIVRLLSVGQEQYSSLLTNYIKAIKPMNEMYSMGAAEEQLEGIHKIVSNWAEFINLSTTIVLLAVAAAPRKNSAEGQCFSKIYQLHGIADPEKSQHIIFLEMLAKQLGTTTSMCLIEAFKQRRLNADIGKYLLDNINAMNEDILGGRPTKRALSKLFPEAPTPKPVCPYNNASRFLSSLSSRLKSKQESSTSSVNQNGFFAHSSLRPASIERTSIRRYSAIFYPPILLPAPE